ncbi:AtpZ/AtpI family protein [Propylenella binzhouense]|uniref:ATP synthase protein I n=1 Tax=Propylenella binzhouense TaxID=2555902 RepID=A0A964WT72_9HYPH|nr:AtpZ/AtpI family protein [Propylenella binzhouense]MYZ47704.1 hypothetical protein [Propylenella binzhouense]
MTDEKRRVDGPVGPGSSDSDLARRLDRLSQSLRAERADRTEAARPARSSGSDYAVAFRLASEFVAGVLVGAALGWGLDMLAGTGPWGMIVFLMLGFAAGVLNVLRSAGRIKTGPGSPGAGSGGEPQG